MSPGRRHLKVLGLLLVAALAGGSILAATAPAKQKTTRHAVRSTHYRAHHLSKAQKRAIKRHLMRAVKRNPKVISRHWFLKQASIVNFSLPTTIRLLPAKGQGANNTVSNDDPKLGNYATLDLGPSLGVRKVGLGGSINATINFNDAYDGGQFGDVRLSLPPGGNLQSTSVPLLSNTDVSDSPAPGTDCATTNVLACDHKAPANQLDLVVTGAGGSIMLSFDGTNYTNVTAGTATVTSDLQAAIAALPNPLTNTGTIGSGNVYTYSSPYVNALAGCPSAGSNCKQVQILFTGTPFNGKPITTLSSTGSTPGAVLATHRLVDGYDPSDASQNIHWDNASSTGGCGSYTGNGLIAPADSSPALGSDVDLLGNISTSNTPSVNDLGDGSYGAAGAQAADTVLRTNTLTLAVATPGGTATVPGDGAVKTFTLGANGGRANLFGSPVNGLQAGNSVDVTVNLETDISDIARQVDGAWPTPSGGPDETQGNINAYSNCRQAWTGKVHNYLSGIKLTGGLKISPAITADGKLRIAKVNLSTPAGSEAKESLAACLSPYSLFMQANPLAGDGSFPAPNLIGGSTFNPLAVLFGSALPSPAAPAPSSAPNVGCDDPGGPLDRAPFNVSGLTAGTNLASLLGAGAAVGVSGDLAVKSLKAEVLIGSNQ